MPLRTRSTDQPIIVGQRVDVDITLTDNRSSGRPVPGLTVSCQLYDNSRTLIEEVAMLEDPENPGRYLTSYVVDSAGEWVARVVVAPPLESIFERRFYVNNSAAGA